MKLLFLNSLKGLKHKKVQMLGIILLVMLSTGIYTAMTSSLDRMEEEYYQYLEKQKVEHISVNYQINYQKDISVEKWKNLKNEIENPTEEEKQIMELYTCYLENTCSFNNNPAYLYQLDTIFQKYGIDTIIQSEKIGELKQKYDFDYELEKSKTLKIKDTYTKIIPYNSSKTINRIYLVEGKLPTKSYEITMLPTYAKIHHIKINDTYEINDQKYKVVGFTYAPDYIYPLISYSSLVFDEKTNNIIYTTLEDYNSITGIEEKTFSIFYHGNIKRTFDFEKLLNKEHWNESDNVAKILSNDSITAGIFSSTRMGRIASLQLEFKTNHLFAEYFLYLLLGISVFVIAIITKKRIEDERLQIGVLKSLGYSPFSIAISYLVYPILGSFVGGILGLGIGFIFSTPLTKLYLSYFLVPIGTLKIKFSYIQNAIFLPMILLSCLSYLIALFMLLKKPLQLLKEGSNLKVNFLSKIVKKLTHRLPFQYRFKYSLALRSIPKLLIVGITSFFTGMLIVLTLIGMNLMNHVVDQSFEGFDYDYIVYMNAVQTEKINEQDDYILNSSLKIKEVRDKNQNLKSIKKDITLNITGVDLNSHYIKILDSSNNNMISLLESENSIIINQNMKELYGVDIGDTIVLEFGNNSISYQVVGISEEFMNLSGYVDRASFSKKIGYQTPCYTSILSKNNQYSNLENLDSEDVEKIATVLSLKDMKNNIEKSIEKYNASIYIVILFASIMAFVIIAVIANIVVEENKKMISLMKVMGYQNKKISSIVLNIYTPIIIISYLLSIPAMTSLLKKIVAVLAGDMEMTIPISLSPFLAIIGLIGLVVAYYIAIFLSKKVLNKIPLAVALKRE